jgi:enamine deaminase RidA (YjgF/YER057c/UK114 family)
MDDPLNSAWKTLLCSAAGCTMTATVMLSGFAAGSSATAANNRAFASFVDDSHLQFQN